MDKKDSEFAYELYEKTEKFKAIINDIKNSHGKNKPDLFKDLVGFSRYIETKMAELLSIYYEDTKEKSNEIPLEFEEVSIQDIIKWNFKLEERINVLTEKVKYLETSKSVLVSNVGYNIETNKEKDLIKEKENIKKKIEDVEKDILFFKEKLSVEKEDNSKVKLNMLICWCNEQVSRYIYDIQLIDNEIERIKDGE